MFRDVTEWSEDMMKSARSFSGSFDGSDYERGDLEEMKAEIRYLCDTLGGLLAYLVERTPMTENEAQDLIRKYGW